MGQRQIVADIAPQPDDIVVRKQKPSALFGTPLMSMLNEVHADSVLVAGTTTSGCVRASVIDAFSYNMKVSVVEECVFDRGQASHKINLFDMAMKYADVISLKETIDYIRGLPDNLYAGYEINAKRQMDRIEDDYRRERISRREYDRRKNQIERDSIIY